MSQSRLDWLITDFTERVANVAHAIVVSADGVTLAKSAAFPEARAGQLAAITCGLSSLMDGAARIFDAGAPVQALVEMAGGLMLVKAISSTAILSALAAPECDMDLVAYEMTLLVEEVGEVLTPPTRISSLAAISSIAVEFFLRPVLWPRGREVPSGGFRTAICAFIHQ